MKEKKSIRCGWRESKPRYVDYHDNEQGKRSERRSDNV
jgi:3-methyladenine DNA glycosylase Tag